VLEIVASAPEGFVVTSLDGRICLRPGVPGSGAASPPRQQARNEPWTAGWAARSGLRLLTAQLREHGALRLFATQLRGEYGSSTM